MKHLTVALTLAILAGPATAQEGDSVMERGLRLFLDGLKEEMEPALRDLEGLAQDAAPFLREMQRSLGEVVDDFDAYAAPEILPNGDILIRRKEKLDDPAPEIEPEADGAVDL